MMAIEHQLSKLSAGSVPMTGEGFGGTGGLTQSDVAGALSGLFGPTYWYMRLKFCGDNSDLAELRDHVAFRILGEAMSSEHDVSAHTARGLATVSLYQALQQSVCWGCRGTGRSIKPDSATDCGHCKGTGRSPMTQELASAMAGVSRPTYAKKYRVLVDRQVAHLEGLESRGLAHVARELRGEKVGYPDYRVETGL